METKWTKEWPKKEGMYWFYGYRYFDERDKKHKPEYCFVKVFKISNGLCHTANGEFMYKNDLKEAWFCKMDLPEPPRGFKPIEGRES